MKNYDAMTPHERLAELARELETRPNEPHRISAARAALLAADIHAALTAPATLGGE